MPDLPTCLETHTWRMLKAITRAHRLPFSSSWTKSEISQRLLARLERPAVVRRLVARLPRGEQKALTTLLADDGHLPYLPFSRRFGSIEPYRPWRPGTTKHPWRRPDSPAQHLYFLGLIYRLPGGPGEDDRVVLPDEFRGWLLSLRPPEPRLETAKPPTSSLTQWPPPNLAVTVLLALCQRESIRPLHNRWLAPRWLARWAAHLPLELDLAGVRSERAVPYLAFMHYLTEAAGLLSLQAGFLKPSTSGWRWLDLPAGEQRQRLWQSWLDDLAQERPLWTAYRLPQWQEIAPDVLRGWLDALPDPHSAGRWYHWLPFARALEHPAGDATADASPSPVATWSLFQRPLSWLGKVIALDPDHLDPGKAEPAGRVFTVLAPSTPSTPSPATWQTGNTLRLPLDVQSRQRFNLLQFATSLVPGQLALTPETVKAALQAGWGLVEIERALVDATGEPLSPGQRQTLIEWETDAHRLTLGWKAILSSPDRHLLAQIAGQRGNRPYCGETLSPHHLQVDPTRLTRLIQRLRRQGYDPWLETATAGKTPPLDASAALWLGLRSYQLLGQFIRLPLRPAMELLEALERDMIPEALAAVQFAIQQIEDDLRILADGYTPALPPLPNAQTGQRLEVIRAALAADDSLLITYLDAGSGQETRRVVDPYRLEERGELHYLAGYCHLRHAERLFRVDRMLTCRMIRVT